VKCWIHESVLTVKAAIGCAEHECLPPIPGRVITDSEPKVSRAPQTEAHRHAVDENHNDAKETWDEHLNPATLLPVFAARSSWAWLRDLKNQWPAQSQGAARCVICAMIF
jgi:hypothetical protein